MMRYLILALALTSTISAAFADVVEDYSGTRFDELLKANGIPIEGVSGTGLTARIDFKTTATEQQKFDAEALKASFNWANKSAPAPAKFVIDCNGDGGIPANMRQNINLMALWFKQGEKVIALDIWTMIKAAATAPQITAIRSHATDNGITLP